MNNKYLKNLKMCDILPVRAEKESKSISKYQRSVLLFLNQKTKTTNLYVWIHQMHISSLCAAGNRREAEVDHRLHRSPSPPFPACLLLSFWWTSQLIAKS